MNRTGVFKENKARNSSSPFQSVAFLAGRFEVEVPFVFDQKRWWISDPFCKLTPLTLPPHVRRWEPIPEYDL